MSLRILLLIHGIITLAAGVVLIVAPNLIPSTVDITMAHEQYLLSYFLGAAELAIAFLSFGGMSITDVKSIHIIVWTLIIFHLSTAALEGYAFSNGLTSKILPNILLRVIISMLLAYFGLYKTRSIRRLNSHQ